MKVELTIDANQMGDTLVDLFKNLTVEQKESVALKVLSDWLKEPLDVETRALDSDAILYARNKYSYNKEKSPEDVRKSSEYADYIKSHPSTRSLMVKEISTQVIEFHKKQITENIQSDPEMTKIMDATLETIKENFPKFVHDAMIAYFTTQMGSVMSGLSQALFQSQQAENLSREVHKRITGTY